MRLFWRSWFPVADSGGRVADVAVAAGHEPSIGPRQRRVNPPQRVRVGRLVPGSPIDRPS